MNIPRHSRIGIVFVAVFLMAPCAWSGSLDTWVDGCEVTDDDLLELLESEAFLVNPGALHLNLDGTYRLDWQFYRKTNGGAPLCPGSRWYGQKQTHIDSLPFRSAVQVGARLVLTAWHHNFDPQLGLPLSFVFGLRYTMVGDTCMEADFDHIPAANVFEATEVWADGRPDDPGGMDFLVLKLDRNANPTFPRVRRSGKGRPLSSQYPGDRMTVIGHPERLAAKTDLEGILYAQGSGGPTLQFNHAIIMNSGSMVYNRDERFIETIVQSGGGATYQPGACSTLIQSDSPWSPHGFSLAAFAENIPAFELLVTPLDTVVHDCAGSLCTNGEYHRTVSAPLTGPNSGIGYSIGPPTGTSPPELIVSFDPPSQGTLLPGESFGVFETIDVTGAPCGTHERTYTVRDTTHGFADVVRHIFNINPPCQP